MYCLVSGTRLCDDGCYHPQARSIGLHCVSIQVHCPCNLHAITRHVWSKKCLKQVLPMPPFSFRVDHLSLRCCFHASKYYYSSCHMDLFSNDIHSAPFPTSKQTSVVVCEGGVTVYAHLRRPGDHSTWRYNLWSQVRGWVVPYLKIASTFNVIGARCGSLQNWSPCTGKTKGTKCFRWKAKYWDRLTHARSKTRTTTDYTDHIWTAVMVYSTTMCIPQTCM